MLSLLVPVLGVANYMLIYQVYPEHAWWHIPIESLGIRYSMTAAVCLMLGILINLPRMPSVRPMLGVWDIAVLCMVFVVIVSEFTGIGPSIQSAALTDKFVKMMVFVFCLTRVTTTRRNFTIVLWALVLGSMYIGYDAWTAPRGAFSRGRLEGVGGPDFRHSSGLSAHMAAMLPLIGAALLTIRYKSLKAVALLSGALTVNTVVLCRTRSAFVGLCVGAIVAVLFAPKRLRMRTYTTMAVAAVCAFALTDNSFWDRMNTLTNRTELANDRAAMGRVEIWGAARRIVAEHPLGVGIGNFPRVLQETNPELGRRAAHNTIILCVAELGLQGIILFGIALTTSIVCSLSCLLRAGKSSDPKWYRYMAYGLLLSIAISFGTQLFTERLYTESFWWVLALPGCLRRIIVADSRKASDAKKVVSCVDEEAWAMGNPLAARNPAFGSLA